MFSKFFWALSRGHRGSRPPFSNSPSPATYTLIIPDVSSSFLSPFYSVTPDVWNILILYTLFQNKNFFQKKFLGPFPGLPGLTPTIFELPFLCYIPSQQNFFSKNFFKNFLGPFSGSRPPFSNSSCSATYPLIFPDVSTSFLSPFYSVTTDVSTYTYPNTSFYANVFCNVFLHHA